MLKNTLSSALQNNIMLQTEYEQFKSRHSRISADEMDEAFVTLFNSKLTDKDSSNELNKLSKTYAGDDGILTLKEILAAYNTITDEEEKGQILEAVGYSGEQLNTVVDFAEQWGLSHQNNWDESSFEEELAESCGFDSRPVSAYSTYFSNAGGFISKDQLVQSLPEEKQELTQFSTIEELKDLVSSYSDIKSAQGLKQRNMNDSINETVDDFRDRNDILCDLKENYGLTDAQSEEIVQGIQDGEMDVTLDNDKFKKFIINKYNLQSKHWIMDNLKALLNGMNSLQSLGVSDLAS
ncbi:MAG: hypothetical protein PHC34_09105 [Candidatus Gastranaerophilales bacterium]|nr:hypothetical protein [Candidatus Gastranaerophilales bacterium]